MSPTQVTIAAGDGIGPEIMEATLRAVRAAGAELALEPVEIGLAQYARGVPAGIGAEAWDSIRRTGVLLKGPISTPQGGGVKSLNVTLRKSLGLFANVRPVRAYAPMVPTKHHKLDLVIVRENEEDLYAGIEHRQTDDVVQCLKLISRPGCEKIARYAFAHARATGRRKVTAMTKDNIMKMTDGLFRRVFEETAADFPEIEAEHLIVDIGAAKLAAHPEQFDVLLCPNLYGDILSDVAAEIAGSVGLAPSANIGNGGAMFEAVHGSAPDIAGRDVANPSGLMLAAVQMLLHVGQANAATRLHNAWLATIEDGIHTADIAGRETVERVGCAAFADAVIARMGRFPILLPCAIYDGSAKPFDLPVPATRPPALKDRHGVDVFVHWSEREPILLAQRLRQAQSGGLALEMITNRGVKVWPDGLPETFVTDHWRCRFKGQTGSSVDARDVIGLLDRIDRAGLDVIKTEMLCSFDGVPGWSAAQGQ